MKKTKRWGLGFVGMAVAFCMCLLLARPAQVSAADREVSAGLTMDNAPQVEMGIPYTTSFTTSNEDDLQHVWVKFTTSSKKAYYTVSAKNFNVSGHFGFTVRTAADEELAVDYGKREIGVEVDLEPSTTYYMQFDGGSKGNFRFTIQCQEDEVGDTKEAASPLTMDTAVVSSIDADTGYMDVDYFSFVAGNYDKYQVTVKNLSAYVVRTDVFSKYEENLGNVRLGKDGEESIELTNLNPGETYYIKIVGGSRGNYRVCVNPMRTSIQEDGIVASTISSTEYNGKNQMPAVSVKLNNENLQKDADYRLEYSNNKNIGTAYVKVIGIGNYSGTKTLSFKIMPKKPSGLDVKSFKKAQVTVQWEKDKSVSGYYIQYSKDSRFKSGIRKVTVNQKNVTTIKGLQSKNTYYVRIASYKKAGGKTYVGKYSAVKKIRIK